ncbi:SusC/RagA family TonB-linked outer membrane protein [Pontibacter actiniarum]|uniref:SusC/RagA family protein n=1 Tax=Pontibacter actiniarum TaxID=323450 RepID=A0A1X9YRT2_9BACT|nr:SusC/RagA family TonB-linked outer membrane protein [Pontibacter actiniarum]ARS35572.1 SusC/RagA family protein [Pontibacter actiniarum]
MRKKTTNRIRTCSLITAACFLYFSGAAQDHYDAKVALANTSGVVGQSTSTVSLSSVLKDLRSKYGIQFSYKADVARDLQFQVPANLAGEPSVDAVLTKVLAPSGLTYKKVNDVYIIVKDATTATAPVKATPVAERKAVQEQTVRGTVTDDSGIPLPGVAVVVKGTTRGTSTDLNGNFSIAVPANATLVFNYIGFSSREVVVGNQATIDVSLKPDTKALQEVVVVGYGTQKKSDLTGAVTAVTEEDFQDGQVTTPEQLISGKVAGVQITSNSGAPGAGSRIRIRGGASLNASNDPLIVIDGVPVDNDQVAGSANPLNFINPDDIASMNILKDASATAIYGSRASNGVIIVTTKSGKAGDKMRINFSTKHSISTVNKEVDVLSADEFRKVVMEQGTPEQQELLGEANTNWQDRIYREAYTTDNNLSVSGSLKNLPYRVSVGYLNQEGVLKTSAFERVTAAVKLTPTFLDDHLKVDVNVKGAKTNSRFADIGAIGAAVAFDPTQPVYQDNAFGGYFEWTDVSGNPITIATRNPLSMLKQKRDEGEVLRSIGNVQLDYKFHFLPELRANLNLGYDISESEGITRSPGTMAAEYYERGSVKEYEEDRTNKLLDFYLNYNKELPGIASRIDATAGYSYQDFLIKKPAFATFRDNGDVRKKADPFPFETQNTLVSFFGRVNYAFKDRYMLTATVRRDGSSRFSEDNRWGTFPSMALAWRIVEESFLKNSTVVSDLKLRVGYGITGQQDISDNDYPFLARYTSSDNASMYRLGDMYYLLLRPEEYDRNLKWEETETYNAGIDFGFLNNRLYGSLDYYNRKTDDLLSIIAVPAGTNLTNLLLTNVGSIDSEGLEAVLNFVAIDKEDLGWTVGVNGSWNRNEITKLNTVKDENSVGVLEGDISGATGRKIQIHSVGYAPYSYYVHKQVYDDNGKPIEGLYADLNEDGIVNDADRYRYKNPEPQFYFGFNSQLNYKNWSLGLLMRASLNNYVYNNVYSNNAAYDVFQAGEYLANMVGNVYETEFNTRQYESDYYIENASFLRMENISLGYNFGKILNDKANLRLNANVQNVFTVTKYDGLDPEIAGGIDNNFYPRPTVYTVGLNLEL